MSTLVGRTIGLLTVIRVESPGRLLVRCECGNEVVRGEKSIRDPHSDKPSCGCEKHRRIAATLFKHGRIFTPEYRAWSQMIQRCHNQKHPKYPRWGGRGISVAPEWRDSFEAFFEHVGARPSPEHSLDRYPNNNGNYEPGNVRWATRKQQTRNTRSNHVLTIGDDTLCMAEWAERSGTPAKKICARVRSGWSAVDAVYGRGVASFSARSEGTTNR